MWNADQRRVAIGAASAASGSALVFGLGYAFLGALLPDVTSPSRLAFALKWEVLPAFALLIGIGRVGNARFASHDAITGATPDEGPLAIDKRYLQNTLEQLRAGRHRAPRVRHARASRQAASPAGRHRGSSSLRGSRFLVGYHKAPTARAFGFGATFYPTVAFLIYDVIALVRS